MLADISDFIRTLVRPVVTLGLVSGFIFAALHGDATAAEKIGAMAGIAMAFWFSDRTHENAVTSVNAAQESAVAAAVPAPNSTVANGRPLGFSTSGTETFEPDRWQPETPA